MNRILSAQFERAASDTNARTVQAVLSTETAVNRGGIFEILTHTPQSIDLSRFPLPVIINHDSYNLPIAVAENPKIKNGKLRATIRFSENDQATQIFNDVVAGITTNLSVGYQITNSHQETRDGQEFLIADSWIPFECSIVAIPADQNAGFNRNFQQPTQNKNMNIDAEKIKNDATIAERERVEEIRSMFNNRFIKNGSDLAQRMINEGKSVEESRAVLIIHHNEAVKLDQQSEILGRGIGDISMGHEDNHLKRAIGDALLMRAGISVQNPSPAARDFRHTGIADIAKIFLDRSGNNTVGLNHTTILQRAFTSSSDFIGVLDNIQNKALQNAYIAQESTFEHWTSERATDFFRDATIVNLGELPALSQIFEGGEYTYGSVDSNKESVQMAKYGKIFNLTWEALRRDDLGAFLTLPSRFGEQAKRTISDLCYAALTSNPTLSDSKAFFHASRGNLSGTAQAWSLTTLSNARASMRKFKGLGGTQFVDAVPTTILVPVALETQAQQMVASITATKSADVTPDWIQKLKVVSDPRLDLASDKDWYLFTDPNAIEGFTRLYLDGEPTTIEQDLGFDVDGIKFKCRLAAGVGAIDWRGAYKVIGA